jgi:hypothetical protein
MGYEASSLGGAADSGGVLSSMAANYDLRRLPENLNEAFEQGMIHLLEVQSRGGGEAVLRSIMQGPSLQ